MSERQERNKQTVLAFYDLMSTSAGPPMPSRTTPGTPTPSTIRGWPTASRQAFIDYFVRMARDYPGKRVEFKRAFADGDHVILHCHQIWPGDQEYAGIDIFRFDQAGKIVEHWDVLQVVPPTAANDNTMF